MAKPKNTLFYITGPRGSGKSITAGKLVAREYSEDKRNLNDAITMEILQGDVAVTAYKADEKIKKSLFALSRSQGFYFIHLDIQM